MLGGPNLQNQIYRVTTRLHCGIVSAETAGKGQVEHAQQHP